MSQADQEAAMMMTMAAAELEHRVELLNKCVTGPTGVGKVNRTPRAQGSAAELLRYKVLARSSISL